MTSIQHPSDIMTLDQARAVLWLRNNRRPMGQLLDEGYLNESRLEWAAQKAYAAQIKEAAGVLLKHLRSVQSAPAAPSPSAATATPGTVSAPLAPQPATVTTIKLALPLEQARATRWPFQHFRNQPMGELVDTRQLTLKDLSYAIENAWEERVRQAAIALLAVRLGQAVEESLPAGPLKVVSGGESYSEARRWGYTWLNGMLAGAGVVLWVLLGIYTIRTFIKNPPRLDTGIFDHPITAVIGVVIIGTLLAIGWGISSLYGKALDGTERQIAIARKGQEGEEQVLEALRQNLDGNWTLFRNVVLPGKNKADIDAVLVGPTGVWSLEIKNFSGDYRNFGEHWDYAAGKRRKLLKKSPSHQAKTNALRLSNFLRADGIRQWVEPAIIWANRESTLAVENPTVAVWRLENLAEELGNIWQGKSVEDATRSSIIEKLDALCEQQRRKAASTM